MSALYNKTTLKKMKKAELVEMFLTRQAQILDDKMDSPTNLEREYSLRIDELIQKNNEQYEEIKSLRVKNDYLKALLEDVENNYKLHKKAAGIYETKLIEEIEILRKTTNCFLNEPELLDDV